MRLVVICMYYVCNVDNQGLAAVDKRVRVFKNSSLILVSDYYLSLSCVLSDTLNKVSLTILIHFQSNYSLPFAKTFQNSLK